MNLGGEHTSQFKYKVTCDVLAANTVSSSVSMFCVIESTMNEPCCGSYRKSAGIIVPTISETKSWM